MRLVVASFVGSVAVLALAGCSAESPRQAAVREAVERHVATLDGYEGEVHCTDDPRPWFVEQQTTVFICTARRQSGGCDWFRVDVARGAPEIVLERRDAGCVLPA